MLILFPCFCIVFMINKCPNALNVRLYYYDKHWMHMSGIGLRTEQNFEKSVNSTCNSSFCEFSAIR